MTRTLVLSTLAEDDLSAAAASYNLKRPGLGDDLLLCVEQTLDRILEHPEAFTAIIPGVRRGLIRRFPYAVIYRIHQHRIEVEALFPLRTDPSRLLARLDTAPRRDS